MTDDSRTHCEHSAVDDEPAAATSLHDMQTAVAWCSPGQLANLIDVDADGGVYLPIRKSKRGNFTMPLYAHPPEEVERLMHVIDRDRYVVAHCVGVIREAIRGRTWLLEGRGPFEWDDDDYRKEFGHALTAIEEAALPLAIVGWDKTDCTRLDERVNTARLAAQELLAKPHGHREMILADIYPDHTVEAKLREALQQAREALEIYANPTGYTDNNGEPYRSEDAMHPGVLAQTTLDRLAKMTAESRKAVPSSELIALLDDPKIAAAVRVPGEPSK